MDPSSRRANKSRFGISAKFGAVMVVSLISQSLFLALLYNSVLDYEGMLKEEIRWAKFADVTDQIGKTLADGWFQAFYKMVYPMKLHHLEHTVQLFKARVATLLEREKTFRDLGESARLLDKITSSVAVQVGDELAKSPGVEEDLGAGERLQRINETRRDTNRSIAQMRDLEGVRHQAFVQRMENLENATQRRVELLNRVILGVILNLLGIVAFSIWLFVDTSKRMNTLTENAKRIALGQNLEARVRGNDELTYLDEVIHSSSDALKSAAEHRKSLMEMLAHDMRAPLTNAILTTDTLKLAEVQSDPALRDQKADELKRNLQRMLALMEDLLTIDKLEQGKLELILEPVQIQSVVRQAIDFVAVSARVKQIKIIDKTTPLLIVADEKRLIQVITNLLSNAIKFSPSNSRIELVSRVEFDFLIVEVADEGPGISVEQQQQIFEKFAQGGLQVEQGFGLGLAISKMIVSRHGGTIGVTSVDGKGSKFWFKIPTGIEDE